MKLYCSHKKILFPKFSSLYFSWWTVIRYFAYHCTCVLTYFCIRRYPTLKKRKWSESRIVHSVQHFMWQYFSIWFIHSETLLMAVVLWVAPPPSVWEIPGSHLNPKICYDDWAFCGFLRFSNKIHEAKIASFNIAPNSLFSNYPNTQQYTNINWKIVSVIYETVTKYTDLNNIITKLKLNIIHSVHFNSIFIVRQMYNLITLIVHLSDYKYNKT